MRVDLFQLFNKALKSDISLKSLLSWFDQVLSFDPLSLAERATQNQLRDHAAGMLQAEPISEHEKTSRAEIRNLAESHTDNEVKVQALKLIGRLEDAESYQLVLTILQNESNDISVRQAALFTLYDLDSEFKNATTRTAFIDLAQNETIPSELRLVINLLCKEAGPNFLWLKNHIQNKYTDASHILSASDIRLLNTAISLKPKIPHYSQQLVTIVTSPNSNQKDKLTAMNVLTEYFPQTTSIHKPVLSDYMTQEASNNLPSIKQLIRMIGNFIDDKSRGAKIAGGEVPGAAEDQMLRIKTDNLEVHFRDSGRTLEEIAMETGIQEKRLSDLLSGIQSCLTVSEAETLARALCPQAPVPLRAFTTDEIRQ